MDANKTTPSNYYTWVKEALGRGEFEQAKKVCLQAMSRFESAGEDKETAIACHLLGEISYKQGEYGDAETWYLKALSIDERNGLDKELGYARTCNNLSAALRESGKYDAAEEWLWRSIRIKGQLGDDAGIAASYLQLGLVARKRSDFETAERRYLDSLALEERLGSVPGMVRTLLNLSRIAKEQDNSFAVEKWHKRLSQVLATEPRAAVAISLGEEAHRAGEGQSARIIYQAALDIADKSNDEESRSISLGCLGDLACEMGDYALAEDHYKESIAIDEQVGAKARAASNCSKLGKLYLRGGSDVQRDFRAAREWFRKELKLTEDSSWCDLLEMHVRLWFKQLLSR